MSELVFGPSVDWLPLGDIENIQPRLDGGYDYPIRKKIGHFIIRKVISEYSQPSLFDEVVSDYDHDEITFKPTLFDEYDEY